MKYQIPDFRGCVGVLVKYSDRYFESIGTVAKKDKKKIGVITDVTFHKDSNGRTIAWPTIFWEGDVIERICHPLNVVPYRKDAIHTTMEMTIL